MATKPSSQNTIRYLLLVNGLPYEQAVYDDREELDRTLLLITDARTVSVRCWDESDFDLGGVSSQLRDVTDDVRRDFANSDYRADFRPADPDWEEPSILWSKPSHVGAA